MRTVLLLTLVACAPDPATEPTPDTDPSHPQPVRGPGLGNVPWSAADLFRPVGRFGRDNGVPGPSPDHPITTIKPFGLNVAAMHGGYLLTAFAPDSGFGPGGLLFYDVSDPTTPTPVNVVYEPEPGGRTSEFREAHALGFTHVDGLELLAMHTGRGVELWDIADVRAPERVGRLELPGVNFGDYEDVAWQYSWQGTNLYVAGANHGVYVVDTSDPRNPVLADRGGAPNPIPPAELGGFRIGPLWAVGNRLIVSSMDNETGYAVLDLSDPLHPAMLGTRTGLDKFYATCFGAGLVVTSMRGVGARMTIDDVSDPWSFAWTSTDLQVDEQLYCAFQDGFVFQGAQDEVVKIDISDPAAPTIVGRGSLGVVNPDHGQVTPFGNLVFIGNDHGTGSGFIAHDTRPDDTPPAVTFVSPADGEVGQGLLTRVGVTFSDGVAPETVDATTFFLRPEGGQPIDSVLSVQGQIVNLQPLDPLRPGTTYELVTPAGGVTDWVGNAVAETFTSRFTTASSVSGDLDAVLAATLVDPGPVVVGQPVTLRLDVDGEAVGEASWRLGEGQPWVHRTDLAPVTHAFDEPGHHTVVVSLTNGVRRVSTSRLVTVHRPLPDARPTRSATIALDEDRALVWTVNHDNDSVSALDADTLALVHEVPVGAAPRAVAVAPDGSVWVTCQDAGTIAILDGDDGNLLDELLLHPGAGPAGLALDPDGDRAFVALEATGEVVAFDTATRAEVARRAVGPRPFGVAVSADGQAVWVTRKVSPDDGGRVYHLDRDLSTVEALVVPADTTTVDAEDRGRGVPNYLLAPGLSPDGAELWLPAKQDNLFRGGFLDGQPLTHETTVRAVVPRLVLPQGTERRGRRLDLNDRAPPVDVVFTPLGDYAFLALQGSDAVAIHDAYSGQPVGAIRGAGRAVQGLAVSADGARLYAHHFLSRTVTAHDLTPLRAGEAFDAPTLAEGATVAVEALAPDVLEGKRVFYAARDPRMSKDGYISCATCHLDGADDGRTWDFTDRGEGLRNTIDLRGRAGLGHGPLHWTGNFDEVQDFENDIRDAFGGRGFLSDADFSAGTRSDPLGDPKAGLSRSLDALAAYVASLDTFPPSPHRAADGGFTEAAQRGQELFATLACAECHGGDTMTDSGHDTRHDVGTLTEASGQRRGGPLDGLDAPTLRGVWATPPYLHDGSAPTLRDVLTTFNPMDAHGATSPLDDAALDDLVAWLVSLD